VASCLNPRKSQSFFFIAKIASIAKNRRNYSSCIQFRFSSKLPAQQVFNLDFLAITNFGNLFGSLRSVLAASLLAVGDAGGIQRSTHYVVANAGKVLYAASADQHNRVLLQVVADARDVRGDFNPICEAHAGHFAQGGIRLFGRLRINTRTHATALWRRLQGRAGRLVIRRRPAFSNQLIECRQSKFLYFSSRAPQLHCPPWRYQKLLLLQANGRAHGRVLSLLRIPRCETGCDASSHKSAKFSGEY
jgi:hypothetical protein